MKTVLLTGATGFLGRNILKVLNQKMNIILVIRSGSENKLKNYNHVKKIVISKDIFKENVSGGKKLYRCGCYYSCCLVYKTWRIFELL